MRWRWKTRRRHADRGIALAEALVSLTVAAMTLVLLTGATWGLQQAAARPDTLQQDATDWLTARRVLQSWTASATTAGIDGIEGRFSGSPTRMQLILDDGSGSNGRPMMVRLDITESDGRFALVAARQIGVRDLRLASDVQRESTVIVSEAPLRLIYQVERGGGQPGRIWTYEPRHDQGLPAAVAIEQGGDRIVTAQLPANRSAICVSQLGEGGLGDRDCLLR